MVAALTVTPAVPAGAAPSVRGSGIMTEFPSSRAQLALVSSLDAREELLEAGGQGGAEARAERNPSLSMLASLAVPGSGQLLQGQRRGYVYLLAEAALWGAFAALDSKGNDERDEYEAYADEHWDFVAYSAWYADTCVDCGDCDDYLCRPLAEYGTQEYYEDIGKYDTYWRWWNGDGDETYIDWDEYSVADEALRDDYYDMRGDSNRHLRQARYAMMAVFLNHVASAVDAFLSARGGGAVGGEDVSGAARASDLGLEFGVAGRGSGLSCALVARY